MIRRWRARRKMKWVVRELRSRRPALEAERFRRLCQDDRRTFWVALPHEIIVAMGADYLEASQVIARSAAILLQEDVKNLGVPKKEDVRAFYQRQRELVRDASP